MLECGEAGLGWSIQVSLVKDAEDCLCFSLSVFNVPQVPIVDTGELGASTGYLFTLSLSTLVH
jgi:hypothetical protein